MAKAICYLEFVSKDLDQSRWFFEEVFGWSITPSGDDYLMWRSGTDGISGGIRLEKPTAGTNQAGTVVYLSVDDMESKLQAIETAGGKVIHPRTLISEEHGYFALFTDTSDVCIGLWSAK